MKVLTLVFGLLSLNSWATTMVCKSTDGIVIKADFDEETSLVKELTFLRDGEVIQTYANYYLRSEITTPLFCRKEVKTYNFFTQTYFRYFEVERKLDGQALANSGEAVFLLKDSIISPEYQASCQFN